ncbi:ATP-dependent translocase ABCB1-like [Rhynchonycteris naso]
MDLEEGRNGGAGKKFWKMNPKSKKDEKKEKKPTVSVFTMFRYSNWLDRLYMLLGTMVTVIHGAGLPLTMLVFGDMMDSFANAGKLEYITFAKMTNQSMFDRTQLFNELEEDMTM